jgi:hypothetical protein
MSRSTTYHAAMVAVCMQFLAAGSAAALPQYAGYTFTGPTFESDGTTPTGETGAGYVVFQPNHLPYWTNTPYTYEYRVPWNIVFDTSIHDPWGLSEFVGIGRVNGGVTTTPPYSSGGMSIDPHPGINTYGPFTFSLGTPFVAAFSQSSTDIRVSAYLGKCINRVSAHLFSAADVFDNQHSIVITKAGPKLVATFSPHVRIGDYDFPVTLRDLAALFEVDHFNWINSVSLPIRAIARRRPMV